LLAAKLNSVPEISLSASCLLLFPVALFKFTSCPEASEFRNVEEPNPAQQVIVYSLNTL